MIRALFLSALMPCVVSAGVEDVAQNHVETGYTTFAQATEALSETAQKTCQPEALIPDFHKAFDAWIGVSHIQFGPIEEDGRALSIAYWPDPKNQTGKALGRLTSAKDPAVKDPAEFADVSVAAHGLFALERLLFEPQTDDQYSCDLRRAIAISLSQSGALLRDEWIKFEPVLLAPYDSPESRYKTPLEAQNAIYTTLTTGLEFLKDQRLGRPLGTFDRPRPTRAEARRSERSQRNVVLNLIALRDLARHMTDFDIPKTEAGFADAIQRAEQLDDPIFAGVADPADRFKIEVLQQTVQTLISTVSEEIGKPMGVSAGFNALDGD